MEEKKYCPACGAELDADGICTNETCQRRRLQLLLKRKKDALKKEQAQEEQK